MISIIVPFPIHTCLVCLIQILSPFIPATVFIANDLVNKNLFLYHRPYAEGKVLFIKNIIRPYRRERPILSLEDNRS